MSSNLFANSLDRVPAIDDILNIAAGSASHVTRNALNAINSSLQFLRNNVTATPGPLLSTTASSATSMAVIASTTVQQWLQQQQDTSPNSTYAFLTNLTYTQTNIYTPADTAPAIEDDEIRLEHAPQLSKTILIKVYFLSTMAFFSLLGNLLTMWNIYKTRIARRNSRHSWSAIYSLIFHLSIADVLVTGFCIFGEAAWSYTVQWLANELTCKLMKLIQMFSLYLSTYVLVLIGVDRWIAVKYPMKSLNMAKRCHRLLGGTYVLSFLLSLPQFFIFRVARGPFIEEFYQCVTHGFYTAQWQEQLYTTFTLVFTFLLPLCILLGTYMSTFRTISSSEKMFQGSKLAAYSTKPQGQTNRQRLIHKAKMKSLRISVVIIIAFLICWTPYNVMMLIFMFCDPDKRFTEDLQSAIFFFGMSNSLVNPLIYGAFHLCPMKRKASKKSNNNNGTYSLNRGDSQRTPSMLTAVTQIDCNGRQVRTYRQSSYYRSISTGQTYKENIGLLPATTVDCNTPGLIRKSASMKSPHPNQRNLVHHRQLPPDELEMLKKGIEQTYHNHSTEIIQNDNSYASTCSHSEGNGSVTACSEGRGVPVVLNYDNQRGGVATIRGATSTSGPVMGIEIHKKNGTLANNMTGPLGLQTMMSGADENVSSV